MRSRRGSRSPRSCRWAWCSAVATSDVSAYHDGLVARLRDVLGEDLVGVYAVGSVACAAYELDLNTGERMPFRAAFDHDRPDLHWFAIDRAIAREHAVTLCGPPARELFGEIPRDVLLPVVARSATWYRENDTANASRAWRYAVEGVWSSKAAAAEWARRHRADGVATIGDATAAYRSNRLDDTRTAYAAVVVDASAAPRERAAAARELGRISWLIDGDADLALEWLRLHDDAANAALLARVLRESGRAREAVDVECSEPDDEFLLQRARAYADLDELDELAATIESLSAEARNGTAASRLELELGLLTSDTARVVDAWNRYFWREDAPAALEGAPVDVVATLVRAGFHREASRYAALHGVGDFDGYFEFRGELERATLEHNRALAHGRADSDAYEAHMNELLAGAEQWNVFWTVGLTAGYMSVHAGHVVEDVEDQIEQDGRTCAVRRVVIDNMLANGYESWLWDGAAAAGGWATEDGTIVQIRPSYVDSVVDALKLRRGTPARERAEADLEGMDELTALATRLKLQAIDQIADASGPDPTAFLSAYWHALVEGTITMHEGRHVLDQRDFDLSGEDLEYRAKLSELRFAPYPRLDLAKIVGGLIGGDTPHGRANAQIVEELRAWAAEHADGPIDELADEQIRAFATAFDRY